MQRRPNLKKSTGYQEVSENNQKPSYTETEKETDTEIEIKTKKESENFDKSKSVDEFHFSIAEQLANHIKSSKQIAVIPSKVKDWAKEISLLERKDLQGRDSAFDDIQKAIEAIKTHDGDQFFPVIESGKSFRQKFAKIEGFLQRQNPKSKTQQTLEAFVAGGEDDSN